MMVLGRGLLAVFASVMIVFGLVGAASAAEASACDRATGSDPAVLMGEIRDKDKLPVIHKDVHYIAFQDKKSWATWTFTQKAHAAHPAVVCRQPVRDGDNLTLTMKISCKGDSHNCNDLERDFKLLNQRASMTANEEKQ